MLSVQGEIVTIHGLLPDKLWPVGEDHLVGHPGGFGSMQWLGSMLEGNPVVAASPTGEYVSVWLGRPAGGLESAHAHLYAQRFNNAGEEVGDVIMVADASLIGIGQFRAAMAADGSFAVAWNTNPWVLSLTQRFPLFARRFDAQGDAVSEATLLNHDATRLGSVAISDSGDFVVGYSAYLSYLDLGPTTVPAGKPSQMYLQRVDAAGDLQGSPVTVGAGFDIQVAMAPDGSFTAVTKESASHLGPFVHRFNADGSSRGEPIRVSWLEGTVLSHQIGMDAAGNFVVAWRRNVDDRTEILVQRFDASGVMLRNAITVSDGSSEPLGHAMILAVGRDGSFLVGWDTRYYGVVPADLNHSSVTFVARAYDATGNDRGLVYQGRTDEITTAVAAGGLGEWIISRNRRTYKPAEFYVQKYTLTTELAVDLNGEPPGIGYEGNFIPGGRAVHVGNPDRLVIRAAGAETLASATVSIAGYLSGDLLEAVTSGTPISASFSGGVLTLSGAASIADYQQVLRSLTYRTTANRSVGTTVEVSVTISDGTRQSEPAVSKISIHVPGRTTLIGRKIFYNNSTFDGNDPAANSSDDAAIAPDKFALRPGHTATFANYTSYTRGINGIIIDLAGEHGIITADDFVFRVGNLDDTSNWAYAPLPLSVTVRAGVGPGGSDRVEIIWADGAIKNIWLQVIVLANGNTGLSKSDSFIFGNYIGDTGNEPDQVRTTTTDLMRAVNRILSDPGGQTPAAIDSTIDFNRDGRITIHDVMAAVNQILKRAAPLDLITINSATAQAGAITAGVTIVAYVPYIWESLVADQSLVVGSASSPIASPQAAVFQAWNPQEEELELLLPASTPTLLMTDPDWV